MNIIALPVKYDGNTVNTDLGATVLFPDKAVIDLDLYKFNSKTNSLEYRENDDILELSTEFLLPANNPRGLRRLMNYSKHIDLKDHFDGRKFTDVNELQLECLMWASVADILPCVHKLKVISDWNGTYNVILDFEGNVVMKYRI